MIPHNRRVVENSVFFTGSLSSAETPTQNTDVLSRYVLTLHAKRLIPRAEVNMVYIRKKDIKKLEQEIWEHKQIIARIKVALGLIRSLKREGWRGGPLPLHARPPVEWGKVTPSTLASGGTLPTKRGRGRPPKSAASTTTEEKENTQGSRQK